MNGKDLLDLGIISIKLCREPEKKKVRTELLVWSVRVEKADIQFSTFIFV